MENLLTTDACTMPTADRPLRLAEFDDLFATALRNVTRTDDGAVRMRLSGEPGLAARVRDLTEREASCCSFFTFTIDGNDELVFLDIAVPPTHRDILEALTERARAVAP